MKKAIPRYILGLIYFVFGLNFFFQFIPMPASIPEPLMKFSTALMETGYFMQFVKIVEVACGALLLMNLFTPLALVILAPITLNILLVHTFLDKSGLIMALVILAVHVFLGMVNLDSYKGMLKAK